MPEWFYNLALALACGRRGDIFRQLCARFGSAKGALAAKLEDLVRISGPSIATKIKDPSLLAQAGIQVEGIEKIGAVVLPLGDPAYPSSLAAILDPPAVLFAKGDLSMGKRPSIGIVGARRADEYGLRHAEMLGRQFARRGAIVVSGGALGIDTAAHKGALLEKGKTIVVLGSGLTELYPKANLSLFEEVLDQNGVLLTELPLQAPPRPENFPRRNRLISGLSESVIIVRGEEKSGASYTARAARDQGRRLFALPGPANDPLSVLPHKLLREGALLCENADDVLFDTHPSNQLSLFDKSQTPRLSKEAKRLYDLLAQEANGIDILATRANLSAAQANAAVLELELAGLCTSYPGGRYAKRT